MILISRFLAATVDYCIFWVGYETISSFLSKGINSELLPCLTAFLFGLCYFGIGNSEVFSGQTLGKRAFGVTLKSTALVASPSGISIQKSCLRFFLSHGIFILGTDLPDFLFRKYGIIASPYILQVHMLFLLIYALSNLMSLILDPLNRTLYDKAIDCSVQKKLDNPISSDSEKDFTSETLQQLAQGAIMGLAFWLMGTSYNSHEEEILRLRYKVEQTYPVRIISVQGSIDKMLIQAIYVGEKKENTEEYFKIISNEVISLLKEKINPSFLSKKFHFEIYQSLQDDDKKATATEQLLPFSVEIDSYK